MGSSSSRTHVEYYEDPYERDLETEKQRLNDLCKRLQEKTEMVNDRLSGMIPQVGRTHLQKLQRDLQTILNPERPYRALILGPTSWGKTTLLQTLCGTPTSSTQRSEYAYWQQINNSLKILDTVGLRPNQDYKNIREIQSLIEIERPDAILIVLDLTRMREWCDWSLSICSLIKKLDLESVPIYWVLTKIDIANEFGFPCLHNENWSEYEDRIQDNSKLIMTKGMDLLDQNFPLRMPSHHIFFTACGIREVEGEWRDIGVLSRGGLLDTLNVESPLNVQILQDGENRYIQLRKSIATKIILSFTGLNALLGALPVVDVMTYFVDQMMVKVLEEFSTDFTLTADDYVAAYFARIVAFGAIKSSLLIASTCLEFSGVLFGIGCAVGTATSSLFTLALGYHAYGYFINDTSRRYRRMTT